MSEKVTKQEPKQDKDTEEPKIVPEELVRSCIYV